MASTLLIRLHDRRVLNSHECCDDCIDRALASIQEIRRLFVDAQAALAGKSGSLAALLELMLAPIRQFLTFAERLDGSKVRRHEEFWRDPMHHQDYFDALEMLRRLLSKGILQLGKVSGTPVPSDMIDYEDPWQQGAFKGLLQ